MSDVTDYLDLPTISEASCDGCGACCMQIGIPPFASYDNGDFEFRTLPGHLKREIRAELGRKREPAAAPMLQDAQKQVAQKPCIWLSLKTRRCLHYENRPFFCHEFRLGSEECRDDREKCGMDILLSTNSG
jgi:Fe-S-cluster containining protein